MAKRRKNRTHNKGSVDAKTSNGTPGAPKSFVIKHGHVGHSMTQLVRDMRKVMEPNTASRLKERTRNKLKDYLVMGPALQVTHLLAFSLTRKAPTFKLVRLPAGPTLSFRLERYSLMKDVLNSRKRKRGIGMEYLTPPLLILAAFPPAGPGTPPHLSLLMKSFQSMFPPLSPQSIPIASCRRVVLVHYNADRDTVDLRHYIITVRARGVSRHVRKILEGPKSLRGGSVLDLGREQDVADYILRQGGADGYESASSAVSDVGEDGEGNNIELAGDYVGRNNRKGQQRSVRLDEVGPRMELRLLKIAEGTPGKEGAVIWHRFVKKTAAEIKALNASHAEQERLRKQRRAEQASNVARKLAGNLGTEKTHDKGAVGETSSEEGDRDAEEWDNSDTDDEPSASEGSLSETDDEGSQLLDG